MIQGEQEKECKFYGWQHPTFGLKNNGARPAVANIYNTRNQSKCMPRKYNPGGPNKERKKGPSPGRYRLRVSPHCECIEEEAGVGLSPTAAPLSMSR